MSVSTPRPAATVVLIRESNRGQPFEVLMVRRNDNVAFMGGAYVFPGGRLDEEDEAAAHALGDVADVSSRFTDLTPAREMAFRAAAVRELEEEAGVRVNASELVPIAHWVTPEIETRRYDTRFFLTEMPPGQEAKHDDHEMTELAWVSPAEAIHQCLNDEMMLPPPTWTTLKGLTRFASLTQVFAWARSTRIVRIQPCFVRDQHKTMLTLPGDPTYPPVDGWEQPEDTRFLLRDGRWRPITV